MFKRSAMLAGVVLATIPLAGCYDDYGYGRPAYYGNYYPASYGWYDGYYGPIHDGYWGDGGYYFYRSHSRDRWRRDDGRHFRASAVSPGGHYYRYDRAAPGRGRGHDGDRGREHDRGRGHGHDRDD
ncbi:MAG: hypothetical protein ACKOPE_00080 [Novosphingobium sp.]